MEIKFNATQTAWMKDNGITVGFDKWTGITFFTKGDFFFGVRSLKSQNVYVETRDEDPDGDGFQVVERFDNVKAALGFLRSC